MSAKQIERSCKCEERADVPGVARSIEIDLQTHRFVTEMAENAKRLSKKKNVSENAAINMLFVNINL